MNVGASRGSSRSVTSRSDFIRVSPGNRLIEMQRSALRQRQLSRRRRSRRFAATGPLGNPVLPKYDRTGRGSGTRVLYLVHWLPVVRRIDERNLDLKKIRHRRARLLEQGLHEIQGIGRLLLDVTGPAGPPRWVIAANAADEEQVPGPDRGERVGRRVLEDLFAGRRPALQRREAKRSAPASCTISRLDRFSAAIVLS